MIGEAKQPRQYHAMILTKTEDFALAKKDPGNNLGNNS